MSMVKKQNQGYEPDFAFSFYGLAFLLFCFSIRYLTSLMMNGIRKKRSVIETEENRNPM